MGLGGTLRAVQLYAWIVFLAAWARMGWVDWHSQKIRNRDLTGLLAAVVLGYCLLALNTSLGRRGLFDVYIYASYYRALTVYAAFSFAAAFLLWWLRVWPAGDVKLFSLLALLYPMLSLPANFHSGLRFLEVLINTFLPASLFVFLMAARYVCSTRLAHQWSFLGRLYARREVRVLFDKLRELPRRLKEDGRERLAAAKARPGELALGAGEWLLTMALMSAASYYLRDVLRSPFAKTLLFFGLFFVWGRLCALFGQGRLLLACAAAALWQLSRGPAPDWGGLLEQFGNISAFSLCISLGMSWAMSVLGGNLALLLAPAAALLTGVLPWGLFGGFRLSGWWGTLIVWAGMGLFYGLALVFVRIWDREQYESLPPGEIKPFLSLGPALLDRIKEDEEFYEENFSDLYADGLTAEQAQALKAWCARNLVELVPLAPTLSFASWIFGGYFLTLVLDGHLLRLLLK